MSNTKSMYQNLNRKYIEIDMSLKIIVHDCQEAFLYVFF